MLLICDAHGVITCLYTIEKQHAVSATVGFC